MVDEATFERSRCYGGYASWAIWREPNPCRPAKDGISDLTIFQENGIHNHLNDEFVLVGLNISRKLDQDFSNFHSGNRYSQDYKLRAALLNTVLWGSYATDLVKDHECANGRQVYLQMLQCESILKHHICQLRKEIAHVFNGKIPTIVALGTYVFNLMNDMGNEYGILQAPHYAMFIGKCEYRRKIADILNNINL